MAVHEHENPVAARLVEALDGSSYPDDEEGRGDALLGLQSAVREAVSDLEDYRRVYTHDCPQGHEWRGAVVGALLPCPWCAAKRTEEAEHQLDQLRAAVANLALQAKVL